MERKLIDYLPPVVREYAEFKGITEGQQPEFEQAWDATDSLMADQFILTAGETGLSRWERILGIVPKPTETLDYRRYTILGRLNLQLPYTFRILEQNILQIANGEPVVISLNDYVLKIISQWQIDGKTDAMGTMLDQIVPQNIFIDSHNALFFDPEGSLAVCSTLSMCEMINLSDSGNEHFHLETALAVPAVGGVCDVIPLTESGIEYVQLHEPAYVPNGATITETINLFD